MTTMQILENAKSSKLLCATLSEKEKNEILLQMANSLCEREQQILDANSIDVNAAKQHISQVMIDRLMLTPQRIKDMAEALRNVANLKDPIGEEIGSTTHENGMVITKKRVPMGVIAIIYESRPNVTADAAALCLKSGNVCVLRGGKEAFNTNKAITNALQSALEKCGKSKYLVNLVEDISRESAYELMQARGYVDLLIPRGGPGLIRSCVDNAKVPCIETGVGICHIYVDKYADLNKAVSIVINAKLSRPSVCNAAEVFLVHKDIAQKFLPMLKQEMPKVHELEFRLCEKSAKIIDGIKAKAEDFDTEFLDYVLAIKIVDDDKEALQHISEHSTSHSEAIVTEDEKTAENFLNVVDSACVYVNASTRFTDGGEFGLGCEIGVSTQKLGARGPMGLSEMTSYKYCIKGNGQVR